jgi:hypothetical protein
LAKFLRDTKMWELGDLLAQGKIPVPDEGDFSISLASGRGSLVGTFPDNLVRAQPRLLGLKAEMAEVMAAVKAAAAKER